MAGAGAGSFGAGFAKGLANVLLSNRQEQRRRAEREEDVKFRNFQATAPIMAQNFFANPTPEGAAALEDFWGQLNPDLMKTIKRTGFSMETLGPFLSQAPAQSTEIIPGTTGIPRQVDAAGQPTQIQARGATFTRPDQQARLFGTPVLSEEQKLIRDFEARRSLADRANLPPEEKPYFALGTTKTALAGSQGAAGTTQLVQVTLPDGTIDWAISDRRTGSPTFGRFLDTDTLQPIEGATPRLSTSSASMGTDRTALAIELFNKRPEQLDQEQMRQVNAELERRVGTTAYTRGTGAGQARIETERQMPIPIPEAARQEVAIGTTINDLTGLLPVTDEQRTRRDAALALAQPLVDIRQLIENVYPDRTGLTNMMRELGLPIVAGMTDAAMASAVLAKKRVARDPATQQLDAAIKLAVGNISRVLAAEAGRLTEQDVQRAQSALTDLQGWTDTKESALAKLQLAESAVARITNEIRTPGQQLRTQPAAPRGETPRTGRGAAPPTTPPTAPRYQRDPQTGEWVIIRP